MRSLKVFFLLAVMSVCSINIAFAQKKKEKSPLDGKTFIIQTSEVKAGKAPKAVEDKLTFKSQKINSDVVEEKTAFDAVLYSIVSDSTNTDADGDEERIISFEAEGTNDKGEDLKWTGVVTNQSIEGTVIWSKKGKTKKEYSFSGNEKEKKKK